jgi:hypothetical protein
MHEALQGATFHCEHIIPSSRVGKSDLDNFAWACPTCNLHKSDRLEGLDPESGLTVRLFHPRIDRWTDHFAIAGYTIQGKTSLGRATVGQLDLNHATRIPIREAEALFGLFPPS